MSFGICYFFLVEEMLVYKYDEMKMNGSIDVKYNRVRCLLLAENYASLIMRWSSQRRPWPRPWPSWAWYQLSGVQLRHQPRPASKAPPSTTCIYEQRCRYKEVSEFLDVSVRYLRSILSILIVHANWSKKVISVLHLSFEPSRTSSYGSFPSDAPQATPG